MDGNRASNKNKEGEKMKRIKNKCVLIRQWEKDGVDLTGGDS